MERAFRSVERKDNSAESLSRSAEWAFRSAERKDDSAESSSRSVERACRRLEGQLTSGSSFSGSTPNSPIALVTTARSIRPQRASW